MRRVLALLAGLTMVVTLGLMADVFAVAPGATEDIKSSAVPAYEVNATSPDRPAEGIAVHGHWTIEVRNPDGTLGERREFENELSDSGGEALASILTRQYSVGSWFILLNNTAGLTPWRAIGSGRGPGTIYEVGGLAPFTYRNFDTLTVNMTTSGLVLRGTATAQDDGGINTVATSFYRLSSTSPPSVTSTGASSVELTTTTLSSPVTLTAGQTVTVSVVISFS